MNFIDKSDTFSEIRGTGVRVDPTMSEFETEFKIEESNLDKFLEVVYHNTNTYSGNLWQIIEPKLSAFRTHTSISVGDEIEIDGQVYICADFGFEKIEDVEIKKFGDAVFSVEKVSA